MKPEDSAPTAKKEPKGGLAIVIGGGKAPTSEGAELFLPKDVLGEHFDSLEAGKEYTVTVTLKVDSKDEEGADASVKKVTAVEPSSEEGFSESEEDDMDDRFKEHSEDEGEDTPDGFAGGMKG